MSVIAKTSKKSDSQGNYPFLEKVYYSKDEGFDYQVKIFKINYDVLEKDIENKRYEWKIQ